ncbi:MAG: polysaccharide biosynthesis protein [Lachnospiraceae bacterium]|nr:polysaccharide biosynthesis protein [Lachnospiraceae bacterium]
MENSQNNKAYKLRVFVLILLDIIMIQISSFMALYIRYEFRFNDIDSRFLRSIVIYAPVNTLIILVIFFLFKLYSSIWKYASIEEMIQIILACGLYFLIEIIEKMFLGFDVPRSHPFMFAAILLAGTFCIRFGYRFARTIKYESLEGKNGVRTMIIGGGQAAAMLIKEIRTSDNAGYNIQCIIDDDIRKRDKYLSGVKVVGGRETILANVKKYNVEQIIIAMPSVNRKVVRDILEICKQTDCKLKKIPGIYQFMNGSVSVSDIMNVEIEDLLGREQINVNLDIIMNYVRGKTVLVTGGGGSIGSELCRQIAVHNPKKLIIVDIYENNAYDIEQELKEKFKELNLVVLIASVRNTNRMHKIFEEYKPDIVYHAAAHKHVPLMENSPNESIKNNVFGTYKTAVAAAEHGVKKFVLISTDKAVNPTNIMGASKRICEMIIQMLNKEYSKTNFVAVRFGNVLGSNGSVIPLFKKQIQAGGPITVTDPEIIRYFMTIPEAVSLVLQAGAYAKGGEIFVLDMGEPVKILDLAKNLIRLSGYSEDEIKIKFTGLRPGEKLYEELLLSEEGLKETENRLIHIGKPIQFNEEEFRVKLDRLKQACENDSENIREYVKSIVETYHYN